MSDLIFPQLAGLSWGIKPVPTWSTVVQRSRNGARTALGADPYPLWTYELSYEFLRGPGYTGSHPGSSAANPEGYSELEQIVGLFNLCNGGAGDFLLDPGQLVGRPQDSTVRGIPIGTGDGTTTTFYLARNTGGFLDEVQDPVAGSVSVAINGVAQTAGWTLGALGAIAFAAAPALNAVITASFRWRMRVCFAEDTLGIEAFMYALYDLQSLKLEQVKQ
jgi:uncharacterized protein (TIGR02217 family)